MVGGPDGDQFGDPVLDPDTTFNRLRSSVLSPDPSLPFPWCLSDLSLFLAPSTLIMTIKTPAIPTETLTHTRIGASMSPWTSLDSRRYMSA